MPIEDTGRTALIEWSNEPHRGKQTAFKLKLQYSTESQLLLPRWTVDDTPAETQGQRPSERNAKSTSAAISASFGDTNSGHELQ